MGDTADREPLLPVDPDVSPFDVAVPRAREQVWDLVLVIAAGGAFGGAARFLLNRAVPTTDFPWATFAENVTGCLLLGALMVFLLDVWTPGRYLRPFLGVGVLGGFTTFSAYTSETRALLLDGRVPAALMYVFGSLIVGLLATWTGITVARGIAGDRVKEDG